MAVSANRIRHKIGSGDATLTSAVGISLGLGFKLGFFFVIYGVLMTGLPLSWMMSYGTKERSRLIAQYHKSKQFLIKPWD